MVFENCKLYFENGVMVVCQNNVLYRVSGKQLKEVNIPTSFFTDFILLSNGDAIIYGIAHQENSYFYGKLTGFLWEWSKYSSQSYNLQIKKIIEYSSDKLLLFFFDNEKKQCKVKFLQNFGSDKQTLHNLESIAMDSFDSKNVYEENNMLFLELFSRESFKLDSNTSNSFLLHIIYLLEIKDDALLNLKPIKFKFNNNDKIFPIETLINLREGGFLVDLFDASFIQNLFI